MTPLDELAALDIPIAYVRRMRHSALWLPRQRIVVLNAQRTRTELEQAIRQVLPLIRANKSAAEL